MARYGIRWGSAGDLGWPWARRSMSAANACGAIPLPRGLLAEDMNWIIDPPSVPFRVQAKIRYRQAEQWATVTAASETWARLEFDTPQRAVTPGQSAVLYRGDLVLGGGTIREAISL